MLQTLKCQADVVVNGAEAVAAVQRDAYDLVLLDCQMPVLDGYDATRQIRSLVDDGRIDTRGTRRRSDHLPIVALTAHTAPADRARSLASGVDEFVSKPVTLNALRALVRRWVAGRFDRPLPEDVEQDASTSTTGPNDEGPINEAALGQIVELDRLSGGGVLARLFQNFLDGAPNSLHDLRTSLQQGDASRAAQVSHAFQSASLSVGAHGMAAIAKKIEAIAKTGALDGTTALAAELDEAFEAVRIALESRLEGTAETAAEPGGE